MNQKTRFHLKRKKRQNSKFKIQSQSPPAPAPLLPSSSLHILLLKDRTHQLPLLQGRAHIRDGPLLHLLDGLEGPGAHVGQEHDLVVAHEARVDFGLVLKDVEAGAGDEAIVQGGHERGLVDHGAAGRVDDHGAGFHQLELRRRDGVAGLGVQRQVQAQHVAASQQVLERHVLGPVSPGRVQRPPVVVDDSHAERLGLLLHVAPDAAHAEDAQHFTLRVVAERGRRRAAPQTLPQRDHAGVEVAQRAQHEEDGRVGRRVVGRRRHVRHQQRRIARRTRVRVDLVVPRSTVRHELPRLGQRVDQLGVKEARDAAGDEGAVGRDHAVELARSAFLDEVGAVARFGGYQLA